MALKAQNMYKTVIGNTDLSLTAGPDESFRVKDIFIANPGSNYLTVYIEKATVGYFRIGGTLGNHRTGLRSTPTTGPRLRPRRETRLPLWG